MKSRQKNNDVIMLTVPKGQRDIIKLVAKEHNMSMNEFINTILFKYIKFYQG